MLEKFESFYFIIFLILVVIVPFILLLVSYIFSPKKYDNEKLSAYECGFDPFQDARLKFEVHFYLVAILFIVFDIEIIYLFIWGLVIENLNFIGFLSMIIFLLLLTFGFIYEWNKGALDWGV